MTMENQPLWKLAQGLALLTYNGGNTPTLAPNTITVPCTPLRPEHAQKLTGWGWTLTRQGWTFHTDTQEGT